jgi:antitoxin YefM
VGNIIKNLERFIIKRRGHKDVAMITADESEGFSETAHLLRSPQNAKRLHSALERVRKQSGVPQTIDQLRNEVGFE